MSKETRFTGTDTYVASDDLMASVEVATKLQKPLLIKGEPGTGDIVQAVRHMRKINAEMRRVQSLRKDELFEAAKEYRVPVELINYVHENGVFVGSGIFKSGNPAKRAAAIVKAVTNYNDPQILAELSEDLGGAMVGINENEIKIIMEERGQ